MKLKLSLLVLGLLAAPLQAATEMTGDIPVDLAKALIGMAPGQELQLYSDLPDDFPLKELPSGTSVVASIDQRYLLRVLVRPESGVAAGHQALQKALLDAGWEAWQPPMQAVMAPVQNGFIAGPRLDAPQMYCRDDAGMLQYSAVTMGQETLFMFNYNVLPPGATGPCNQGQGDFVGRNMNAAALQQHMPRLELPAALTTQGIGLQPAGSMGSSQYYETSAGVATDLTLTELFEHFVQQIEAQGWDSDASNVGESVANGFWRKQPQDDLDLVGILTVIRSDDENFQLQFRVQLLGAPAKMATIGIRGVRSFGP